MKLKPNVHHTVSRTTANQAPEVEPKKSGAVSPNQPKALVISPVSGVYMKAKIEEERREQATQQQGGRQADSCADIARGMTQAEMIGDERRAEADGRQESE